MNFNDLDRKMRVYETLNDHCISPAVYMIARIDGRSFTRLTKEQCDFEAPYDARFRDRMVETVCHLMGCGFKVIYGYTQSDEISLLLDREDATFARKERKLNSLLAGEASAKFTHLLGKVACFDCRISQLPTTKLVEDYFRWRQEDAGRNALNAHCYWMLRHHGFSANDATKQLEGMSVADKNELLFKVGINFNELPLWQKRGVGVNWKLVKKVGWNPKLSQETTVDRREINIVDRLPRREEYAEFVRQLL